MKRMFLSKMPVVLKRNFEHVVKFHTNIRLHNSKLFLLRNVSVFLYISVNANKSMSRFVHKRESVV